MKIYTIGHSNHTLAEFLTILKAHAINRLVDVRTIAKSRHVPWSNKAKLSDILTKNKISYTHMPALGGLRHASSESINTAWRNKSFRGYADYMQTNEFYAGLKTLMQMLKVNNNLAIMCAEVLPWRCHRSLIADALIIRHIHVWHILSKTAVKSHVLTSFAKINRKKRPIQLFYP